MLLRLEYQNNFTKDECRDWTIPPNAAFVEIDGRTALSISKSDKNEPNAMYTIILKPFRGKTLRMTCDIKAVNVSKPAQPYNGVKFNFVYEEDWNKHYDGPTKLDGTFEWVTKTIYIPITNKTSNHGYFTLGMQDSTGTTYFSNLRVESGELYPKPELSPNFRAEYTRRVTKMPILRGVMSPTRYLKGDLTDLRDWNASLVRWQLNTQDKFNYSDVNQYENWLTQKVEEFDKVLNESEPLGLQMIIDMHLTPGGRDNNDQHIMFNSKELHDLFIECWKMIATNFKGKSGIWAYDLMNEPNQINLAEYDYLTIQYEAARAIREIDDEIPIIVTSNKWSGTTSYSYMSPLPLKNIIYQAHMYTPHDYTHQGVKAVMPDVLKPYPGIFYDVCYDKERLNKDFKEFIEFQQNYRTRMYIGEFSAIRWAPGAAQYLDDLISIFEEHGWDWSYHAFREWSGWSVEHDEDPKNEKRVNYDTDRKKVLLKYFDKNSFDEITEDNDFDKEIKTQTSNSIKKVSDGAIAGIAVACVIFIVFIVSLAIYFFKKKKNNIKKEPMEMVENL